MLAVLEIDDDALLAAIEQREVDALTSPSRFPRAHLVATRALDLDHFRTGFGEHQGRKRARQQRGEVENETSIEWSHDGRLHSSSAAFSAGCAGPQAKFSCTTGHIPQTGAPRRNEPMRLQSFPAMRCGACSLPARTLGGGNDRR